MLGFSPLASAPLADSGVTSVDYALTADAGSFALKGQTADLNVGRNLVAAVGSFTKLSKLPPVASVIVAEAVSPPTYTSSLAGTVVVPEVAPSAIVIVAPLLSVTVTAPSAGFVSVAV